MSKASHGRGHLALIEGSARAGGPSYHRRHEKPTARPGQRVVTVPADEWQIGSAVRVSTLTPEMVALLAARGAKRLTPEQERTASAFYVWLTLVDATGDRLFREESDIAWLAAMPSTLITRIFAASLELNREWFGVTDLQLIR